MTSLKRLADGLGYTLVGCADLAARTGHRAEAITLIDLAYAVFAYRLACDRCCRNDIP